MGFTREQILTLLEITREAQLHSTFRERMEAIARYLGRLVPATSLVAVIHDPNALEVAGMRGGEIRPLPIPPERFLYVEGYALEDAREFGAPYLTEVRVAPLGPEKRNVPRLLGPGPPAEPAAYLPKPNAAHFVGAVMAMPHDLVLSYALSRATPFEESELEAFEAALVDIARVTRRALLADGVAGSPFPVGGRRGAGIVVFDAAGRITSEDEGATTLARKPEHRALLAAAARRLAAASGEAPVAEETIRLDDGWLRASLSRHGSPATVVALLTLVARGSRAYFDAVAHRYKLTPRERDVATLAVQGLGTRELAGNLGMSPITAKLHLSSIFRKTGVERRTGLTALFLGGPGART
jgi:DNA-binding CsgD family transcriptional regulator